MASTASQLAALGNDPQFQYRIRSLMLQQAAIVYAEVPANPDTRRIFAKTLLTDPFSAIKYAVLVANRTNILAGNTTYDFTSGHVITDVSDASIISQIATDWNMLAGV